MTIIMLAGVAQIYSTDAFSYPIVAKDEREPTVTSCFFVPRQEALINETKTIYYKDIDIINILGDNYFKLVHFKSLKRGWDGYDARTIPSRAIENAKAILLKLTSQPQLFPTGRGSVQIEFHKDEDNLVELEVFSNRFDIYVVRDGEEEEKTVGQSEAIYILNDYAYYR